VSHADDVFIKNFLAIIGALVLYMIIAMFVARTIGSHSYEQMQSGKKATLERIAPVGEVRVGAPGQQVAVKQPSQPAQAGGAGSSSESKGGGMSGKQVFNSICTACHSTGAAGAPKVGDKNAWAPRAKAGLDAMVQFALKGKGAMPPKGGNPSLTEDEIRKTIEYMMKQTGITPG